MEKEEDEETEEEEEEDEVQVQVETTSQRVNIKCHLSFVIGCDSNCA